MTDPRIQAAARVLRETEKWHLTWAEAEAKAQQVLAAADRAARRPIAEAPKDGTPVLIWLGKPWSCWEKARWYEPWENWQVGILPADPAREEYHGIGSALPTYYQPLPAPPEGDSDDG